MATNRVLASDVSETSFRVSIALDVPGQDEEDKNRMRASRLLET